MAYTRYPCRKRGCFCGREVYLLDIEWKTRPIHCDEYERAVESGRIPKYKPRG